MSQADAIHTLLEQLKEIAETANETRDKNARTLEAFAVLAGIITALMVERGIATKDDFFTRIEEQSNTNKDVNTELLAILQHAFTSSTH